MASNSKTEETDELLLVITPHVVDPSPGQSTEVWLPKGGHQ
jgi:Flp pilus assembly secretin CpaC